MVQLRSFRRWPLAIVILLNASAQAQSRIDQAAGSGSGPAVVNASNGFGFDLVRRLTGARAKNENLVLSPISASSAFTALLMGTRGQTYDELAAVFRLTGIPGNEITGGYQALGGSLTQPSAEGFAMANSFWSVPPYATSRRFASLVGQYFGAEILTLGKGADPIGLVNGWVNEHTKGRIPKVLEFIPPELRFLVVNTAVFDGKWGHPLNLAATAEDKLFKPEEGEAYSAHMIDNLGQTPYAEGPSFQAIRLDYKNPRFACVLILPKDEQSIVDVCARLQPGDWTGLLKSMKPALVRAFFPAFKIRTNIDLVRNLGGMGAKTFSTRAADLTGIVPSGGAYVGSAIQSAMIEMDEFGTKAAAATAIAGGLGGGGSGPPPPQPILFRANKPFFYAIVDQTTQVILFEGIVAKP